MTTFTDDDVKDFDKVIHHLNKYFDEHPDKATPFREEMRFLNASFLPAKGIAKVLYTILPYPFALEYDTEKVEVHRDEVAGMFYVYLDGKKLYYHRGYTSAKEVQKSFTFISAEQHPLSPHRYLNDTFFVQANDVVADIGSAEGNFALMVVDKVKKVILVETEGIWMEALQKTFEPWNDKVTIVNKSIGSVNDHNTITLDKLHPESSISVLKMDIEGAELHILKNSLAFIQQHRIKLAACVYHRHHDAADIKKFLENNGYKTSFSKGFMLFIHDALPPPFFRRGLIYASK